ncbi:MAG: sensor histidine kinase [Bacteroidetes bacterium]|nr:MAG: sensor histidine kinase [Bacteroidota bacterium]
MHYFNSSYKLLFKDIFAFCLIFVLSICSVFSQNSYDQEFENNLDEILFTRTTSYSELASLFGKFENDSIKMNLLNDRVFEASYFEAESYVNNALGIIYRNHSMYERAIEHHEYAEELATYAENLELKVLSLNLLGVVYRRMDLVSSALDYHSQALEFANTANPITEQLKLSIAVSLNSMGNIYLVLKQYDLALEQFNKSLEIEIDSENNLGLAINYQNIGYAKEAKGLLEDALKDYQTSLMYNEKIDSEVGRVICYNSIGKIYVKQKKYDEALPILQNALSKALQIADQYYIAASYTNIGWLQSLTNKEDLAEQNLKKAIEVSDGYGLISSKIEALQHLSENYQNKGIYDLALRDYKMADSLENTINNQRNLSYINDLIIKYESESKTNTIKALANENELVKSRLEQNRLSLLLSLLAIVLVTVLLFIFNRQQQINQEKKILTLEQNMLKSQMNPHFIFNSLNSIKLYIINNEKENAVYYLNKFAKLIRKILVVSNEKDISLADELDTMRLYMNIENIRFSNEIDFQINIDANINPDNIRVPSLILQPFLENSLWHGLSSKTDEKGIVLDVKKENEEYITISITDNGVGRKVSNERKQNKTLKRKSVGIDLTKERLFNFSKRFSRMYDLKIEDLFDAKNNATGTKVILKIPV